MLSKSKLFMIFYSASLKTSLQYLLSVISIRFISLQHLAVVCRHDCVPYSLVSALHNNNTLVEMLILFFTHGTKILRKEINMRMQAMQTLYSYCNPVYGSCCAYHSLYFHNLGFFYFLKNVSLPL